MSYETVILHFNKNYDYSIKVFHVARTIKCSVMYIKRENLYF